MKISKNNALPYQVYCLMVFFLAIVGLIDSSYLAYTHFLNYTDVSYSSFCAISKAINCDTVAQSPWSILLGIPIAIWGILGYLLFIFLLLLVYRYDIEKIHIWSILLLLGSLYSLGSLFLGTLSVLKIHSFCLLCIVSYTVNFALVFSCWIVRRRFSGNTLHTDIKYSFHWLIKHWPSKIIFPMLLLSFLLIHYFIPTYWEYALPAGTKNVSSGMTKDGHPWIGAENPKLTIEEYSDYQCFQCYKVHFLLRRLIAEGKISIRLIHRNYPMDNEVNSLVVPEPFHIGSGRLALVAIAASFQNTFWPMNDALYQAVRKKNKKINIKKLATQAGIDAEKLIKDMYSARSRKILSADIRQGWKYTLTGTPSFVINNTIYTGHIPPEILKTALLSE